LGRLVGEVLNGEL